MTWHAQFMIALSLALMLTAAPIRAATPPDDDDKPTASARDGVLTLSPSMQQSIALEIMPAQAVLYSRHVRGFATVLDLAPLIDQAAALRTARLQSQAAQARVDAARIALDRAKSLFRDQQAVSLAQLQSAEAAFRAEQSAQAIAVAEIKRISAAIRANWGATLATAIADGAAPALELIDGSAVLVQIALPPSVGADDVPKGAEIKLGGHAIALRLISPAARVDPKLPSPSFLYLGEAATLQPGMILPALVALGDPVEGRLIPDSAIVRWQAASWAYLRIARDQFTRTRVDVARVAPGGGYVALDLPDGAELVTQGAQLLLSQEFRGALPEDD